MVSGRFGLKNNPLTAVTAVRCVSNNYLHVIAVECCDEIQSVALDLNDHDLHVGLAETVPYDVGRTLFTAELCAEYQVARLGVGCRNNAIAADLSTRKPGRDCQVPT
jgi:hypothetical protein